MTPSQFAALDTLPVPLHEPVERPTSPDDLWALLRSARPEVESASRLGEALQLSGLIDGETLRHALEVQSRPGPHRLPAG